VDGAELQVLVAADRLGHRGVEDVGPDRGHRRDAEDEDQQRRHQRGPAHPGHPDEHADAEPEHDQARVDAEAEDFEDWIHAYREA
jgi:hypothetical protein